MFIDQMVSLSPEDNTKVVEANNTPFDLAARGQFNDHMAPVPTNTIEKLILDINLIFHQGQSTSSPQKRAYLQAYLLSI